MEISEEVIDTVIFVSNMLDFTAPESHSALDILLLMT